MEYDEHTFTQWLGSLRANPDYAGHPLLAELEELGERYRRLAQREQKVTRISDLMQRQLLEMNAELETANRAKSEFLAVMSHEVRTPLNGILGIVQVLERTRLDGYQRERLQTLSYAGQALSTLLENVLDLAHLEGAPIELERKPFEPRRLVESIAALNTARAEEKGVRLETEFVGDIPQRLLGDSGRLGQLLLNLVSNAVKFTEQGQVAVCLEALDGAGRYALSVSDTGIGTDRDPELLFRPFTQAESSTRREHGGNGLGLAICKRLAEAMEAELSFVSRKGQGTRVCLTLNLCSAPEAGEVIGEGESPLRAARVLVVEDERVNQDVLCALLEHSGHRVCAAADGEHAVAAVQSERPDVVLMDLHMPKLDGIAATARIRALADPVLSRVPILLLSADTSPINQAAARKVGVSGFLAKPVDIVVLNRTIDHLLRAEDGAAPECAADSGDAGDEHVDAGRLAELLRGLNRSGFDNLFNLFQHRAREYLDSIREADGSDPKTIASQAHRLVGASGTLGLRSLSNLAARVEQQARGDGGDDALDGGVEALELSYRHAMDAVNAWLAQQ